MISEPIGDAGLKVEDSRTIVEMANDPGVGDRAPTVLVGPVDLATPEAADALLKTLEEVSSTALRIVLWADYLKEVIPTIQSRTLPIWCPPGKHWIDPLDYQEENAIALLIACEKKDWVKVISLLETVGKDWPDLIRCFSNLLEKKVSENWAINLWLNVKKILDGKGSHLVALNVLLPADLS